MKKVIILLLIIFPLLAKAQGHALGVGAGIDLFGVSANINYQYTYKLLNFKTKIAYIPQGLYYIPNKSFVNDYFLGIHTKEGRKVLLSVNTGVSLLYTASSPYNNEISDQANPIQNFNLAFCINPQHRITTDLSISTYQVILISKYGGKPSSGIRVTFEVGYSYLFKHKHKNEKTD